MATDYTKVKTFGELVGSGPAPLSFVDTVIANYTPEIQSTTKVGVEIECENVRPIVALSRNLQYLFGRLWIPKEDGSLRNHGSEWVTARGVDATQASQALKVLEEVFATQYTGITANARTGVHVHLDFSSCNEEQLGCFVALYCLFEKSLFKFSGYREKNVFTVRVRASRNAVPDLLRCIRKKEGVYNAWRICRQSPKYLALNIGAISNFGTVELRQAAGTTRPTTVIPWLKVLVTLRDYAVKQDFDKLLRRIRDLNTNSQYEELIKEALIPEIIQKVGSRAIVQDMIQGCSWIKESLIPPEEVNAQMGGAEVAAHEMPDLDDFDVRPVPRNHNPTPRRDVPPPPDNLAHVSELWDSGNQWYLRWYDFHQNEWFLTHRLATLPEILWESLGNDMRLDDLALHRPAPRFMDDNAVAAVRRQAVWHGGGGGEIVDWNDGPQQDDVPAPIANDFIQRVNAQLNQVNEQAAMAGRAGGAVPRPGPAERQRQLRADLDAARVRRRAIRPQRIRPFGQ